MKNGRYEEFGIISWFKDEVLHREGGPARVWLNGTTEWFVEGKRHRLDGPAVELANGRKEWYINGTVVDITLIDYDGSRPLTDEEMTFLLLSC